MPPYRDQNFWVLSRCLMLAHPSGFGVVGTSLEILDLVHRGRDRKGNDDREKLLVMPTGGFSAPTLIQFRKLVYTHLWRMCFLLQNFLILEGFSLSLL